MFFFAILYALLKIITLLKINKFILSLSFLSLSFIVNIRRYLLFYIKFIKITSISKNEIVSTNVLIFINLFSISLIIISKYLIIDYLDYRITAIECVSFSISLVIISKYLIIDYLNYRVFAIEYID